MAQTRAHDARHRRRPCLSPVAHRPTNILKCTSTYHRLRAASMLGANHMRDAASMGMMRIRPPVYRNDMAIAVAGIVRREKGAGSRGIFHRAWERRKTVQLNMFYLPGGQHRLRDACQTKPENGREAGRVRGGNNE